MFPECDNLKLLAVCKTSSKMIFKMSKSDNAVKTDYRSQQKQPVCFKPLKEF